MALKPFQRRVGSPRAVPLTQVRQTPIPDISPQLNRLAGELGEYGIKIRGEEAERQAIQDVAEAQIPKDENGNFVMPEAQGGGRVYRATFEQSMVDRYSIEVTNDIEKRLNSLYYDQAERFGRTPDELRDEASTLIDAVVSSANPLARANIARVALREQNQRDLGYRQGFQRKQDELTRVSLTSNIEQKGEDLYTAAKFLDINDPQGLAALQNVADLRVQSAQSLVDSGQAIPGYVLEIQKANDSLISRGQAYKLLIDNNANAGDIDRFIQMLNGDTTIELYGYNYQRAIGEMSLKDRSQLSSELARRGSFLSSQEVDAAKEAADQAPITTFINTGSFAPLTTTRQKLAAATEWLTLNGFDPTAPDGEATRALLAHVKNPNDIPRELYGSLLQNLGSADVDQAQRAMDVYTAFRYPETGEGTGGLAFFDFADAETISLLEIATDAQRLGRNGADAFEFAKSVMREARERGGINIPETGDQAINFLESNQAFGSSNNRKDIYEEAFENAGLNIEAFESGGSGYASDDLNVYASTLIINNVAPKRAVEIAVEAVKGSYTFIEPGSPFLADGDGAVYIRNEDLPPPVLDILPSGIVADNPSYDYIEPYVNEYIKQTNLFADLNKDDLKLGDNIFIKKLPGSNGVYHLMLRDNAGFDTALRQSLTVNGEEFSTPILLDLRRAANIQNEAAQNHKAAYESELDEIESLRPPSSVITQIAENLGIGGQAGRILPGGSAIGFILDATARDRYFETTPEGKEYFERLTEFNNRYRRTREDIGEFEDSNLVGNTGTLLGGFAFRPATKSSLAAQVNINDLQIQGSRNRMAGLHGGPEHQNRVALVREVAQQLGVRDYELAAILLLESGMDPTRPESTRGEHVGLYQMSPTVQAAFNLNANSSFEDQIRSLPRYLTGDGEGLGDTLYRRNDGWRALYASINGGNKNSRASDRTHGPYQTMEQKFGLIQDTYFKQALQWLGYRQE